MNPPQESDWKKFRAGLDQWRERYLAARIPRLIATLQAEGKSPTERFWDAEQQIAEEARTLRRCFDDIARSKMTIRLWDMRRAGIITRADLADFSAAAQDAVFGER
ncbi:MAG: hypothetical protein C0503_08845 [Gemmatimonas sp.]|nr:hypothetical protein [Gemmatimonas sp.]